jgi:hypothetical protein
MLKSDQKIWFEFDSNNLHFPMTFQSPIKKFPIKLISKFVWRNWLNFDMKILEFLKSIWYQFLQTNAYQNILIAALKFRLHRKDIYQRICISHILSKNGEKRYSLSFFWVGYVEGYNILILGIYKFLYPILFRKSWQFWGTFALQNAFLPASEALRVYFLLCCSCSCCSCCSCYSCC